MASRYAIFGALIAASLAAPAAMAAETVPIRATYEVYFGGLHILSAQSEFRSIGPRGTDGYSVTGRSKTQGVLAFLFDWRGETVSSGRFVAGRALPRRHENRGWRGDETRIVELVYGDEGQVVSTSVTPPPDPDEVTTLPDDAADGTIDPLSVVAQLSNAIASGGTCDGEFAVFDGRRRYDLRVSNDGEVALPATDYSIFKGAATACRIDYAMIGGQRKERSKYAETARDRVVYVAHPIPGGPAIPVALKIETGFGTLMAHLTALETSPRLADATPR